MKKDPLAIAISTRATELGLFELVIEDQHRKRHTFKFLPSHVGQFAETLKQVPPAQAIAVESLPPADAQLLARVAAAEQSKSAGFAVYVLPQENIALLSVREICGDAAQIPLDADYLHRLIHHLSNAVALLSRKSDAIPH